MNSEKFNIIRSLCIENSNPEIVRKYNRYFKGKFDGYGIERDIYEEKVNSLTEEWASEMNLEKYLDLGDELMRDGRFEEKSFAIRFLSEESNNYTPGTFDRISGWFRTGIDNWATTDVICMLVISDFLRKKIIGMEKLMEWNTAESEWQRRCVPVSLNELVTEGRIKAEDVFPVIDPIMNDGSEYVQKGIGTLLRSLWKVNPGETEKFLMKWKESCGRLIIQYATEKMDKEYRKQFRKSR